jgi:anion-transporting  ArsA/GET3 family ATPase
VLTKVLGAGMLRDIQGFVASMDTMFGGFRERAEATYRLLQARGTSFVVVATPEPDALREASYFVDRLATEGMPLAGLVLNRVHRPAPGLHGRGATEALGAERSSAAAETLEESGEHGLTARLLRLHSEGRVLTGRERRLRERFTGAHPGVPVCAVPALAEDVHDLDGLRTVGEALRS